MPKISDFDELAPEQIDDSVTVPVVKDGLNWRASLLALAAPILGQAEDVLADILTAIEGFETEQRVNWIVSPTVHGLTAGTGTLSDPFSLEHAGTGGSGRIKPGHTVWRRGGIYRASLAGLAGGRWNGFRIGVDGGFGGEPGKRVVFRDYPGEVSVFDDPLVWTAKALIIDEPGRQVYEVGFEAGLPAGWIGGSYRVGSKWYPLVSYRVDALTNLLEGTSSLYNSTAFFVGPGVARRTGLVARIRLNDPYIASQDPFFAAQPYGNVLVPPVSLDPDTADLALFLQTQLGIQIDGDWIEWRGSEVNGFAELIRIKGDNCRVLDVKSKRCPYIGIKPLGLNTEIGGDEMDLDGNMYETGTTLCWGDVKNGTEIAVQNRNQAIPMGDGPGGIKVYGRAKFRNFYDASVILRPGIEIGGAVPESIPEGLTGPAYHDFMLSNGPQFINIWDDAAQIGHRSQGLHIKYCTFKGAGISRDGTGATTDYGSNFPIASFCIFDARATSVMENRRGRNSTRTPALPEPDAPGAVFGNNNEAGRRHRAAISAHGPNSTSTSWFFPWTLVNCTLIVGDDLFVPLLYNNVGLFNGPAGLWHGVPNRVLNCIVIDNGLTSTNAYTDRVRYLDLTAHTANSGRSIMDGNFWAHEFNPPLRHQLLTTTAGAWNNRVIDIDEYQAAPILGDVQPFYPNGWEKDGVQVQAALADVIDPVTYRPIHPAAKTGAVDTTLLGIPGVTDYVPWRGARPPLELL